MTKIKFCGLTRPGDIQAANQLKPAYIGFVFAPQSRRYITPGQAASFKRLLDPGIQAVGVFADESPETIAGLLRRGVIDMAQLHGGEDAAFIRRLRRLTSGPIIQAFRIGPESDMGAIDRCTADYVLLDSGAGTGTVFDWSRIRGLNRPYFLAGGLSPANVQAAVKLLRPFAVDVSSGIETDGVKDQAKMAAFAAAVRKEGNL